MYAPDYMYVYHVYVIPMEARKEPWTEVDPLEQQVKCMWMLETKPKFARTLSSLNLQAIFLVPKSTLIYLI